MLSIVLDNLLIYFFFFLISSFSGAGMMYFFARYIFKILIDETLDYNRIEANAILVEYKEDAKNIEIKVSKYQSITLSKFESINKEIQDLSKVLVQFKSHMIKVESLENEIVMYKKIIRRLERKLH